ncbi:outer membrane lipoprotein carrier protein LolA [Bordetella sp. FB-8]|uniref:LolA family protein n=1 Tax=Bordetella sp. FB-8 TaxID=1159870 RepID=UPI000364D0A5|nr:outer membrane lipoprotein carrier protein LolA [Bordetella sp. FB-8]
MKRWILLTLLALVPCMAGAFGLGQLQAQLRAAPIVRGHFVQQKFLRSLPQPLTSRGDFTLAQGKGLLWQLTSPFAQDLRITPQGIAKRDERGQWQALPQQLGASRETGLFLAVLAGDTHGLQENFDISLTGHAQDWTMTMKPSSALLSQVFDAIVIQGDALVRRIELRETQGDRTVLQLQDLQPATQLNAQEQRAYAH